MSSSLWPPNLSQLTPPRGMRQILNDAVGDIEIQSNGDIQLHVDTVGIGASGAIADIRYNCYLRVAKTGYTILLFRVTTPVTGPWPAKATTPEGDAYPDSNDETEFRVVIGQILQRERTKEVYLYLLSTVR
jgi:hypothetical protein